MHDSLLTYLVQGGATLWVLIACSVFLIALVAERASKLRALDIDHEWLLAQMSLALERRDPVGAIRVCQQAPGALARVFEAGLYRTDHARDEIESAMTTAIAQQGQRLEKNLAAIGTMAVVAPFIGLFGTVIGIVRAFKDLGGSNTQAVNAGIAEALASTAAGLFVAILAVVCFNYFKNRVRAMTAQMNVSGSQLVEMIVLGRSGRPFPHDLRAVANTPAYTPPIGYVAAQAPFNGAHPPVTTLLPHQHGPSGATHWGHTVTGSETVLWPMAPPPPAPASAPQNRDSASA